MHQLPLSFLAQEIISSARHSAILLQVLRADFLAPTHIKYKDWLVLLKGETSTACLLIEPPLPILWESSRGPPVFTALMKTPNGFFPVWRWISSKHYCTIRHALNFLPVFLPWNIRASTSLSTMGHYVFLNLRT